MKTANDHVSLSWTDTLIGAFLAPFRERMVERENDGTYLFLWEGGPIQMFNMRASFVCWLHAPLTLKLRDQHEPMHTNDSCNL